MTNQHITHTHTHNLYNPHHDNERASPSPNPRPPFEVRAASVNSISISSSAALRTRIPRYGTPSFPSRPPRPTPNRRLDHILNTDRVRSQQTLVPFVTAPGSSTRVSRGDCSRERGHVVYLRCVSIARSPNHFLFLSHFPFISHTAISLFRICAYTLPAVFEQDVFALFSFW